MSQQKEIDRLNFIMETKGRGAALEFARTALDAYTFQAIKESPYAVNIQAFKDFIKEQTTPKPSPPVVDREEEMKPPEHTTFDCHGRVKAPNFGVPTGDKRFEK